ncbi:siderophore-interacting protein [Chryseobacterium culicis]|uniref:NADPH-dependent ferric siderophore reductase n=1 Tax=Chryseobacterium culicis TaxID=680127 RepID=A0A2S9CPQ8_CHRCI|nr:siderophore-interacting protein [Chryseobacterium culicis]PRB82485.1 NADPH-dependent ferric siderophore reductase [Chryseobacterium culicis]PRB88860.1 NADPH-dependent ferric siderophore reductase [Chryseobacterium culicis]
MAKISTGQIVAEVTRKEYITDHFIRVYLYSPEVQLFRNTMVGDNNKIAVPPAGLNEIHFPTLDENHQWVYPPKEVAPAIRTYTHRGIDLEKNELIIDFVDHGDGGPASRWVREAEAGSKLGVMMRLEGKELYPAADWYLLVGDATAIPVISAILETLPETAKGTCIIEVHGKEDEQLLETNAQVDFKWLHNAQRHISSEIVNVVKSIEIPETTKFGYVACEFSSVKEIRTYLRKEKNWTSQELYAYSYWKAGVAENESQADRHKEKDSME